MTPFTLISEAKLKISMVLEDLFLLLNFVPVHPYFYPSTTVFTRPNDGWTGIYIKLCYKDITIFNCVFSDTCQRLVAVDWSQWHDFREHAIFESVQGAYLIWCCSRMSWWLGSRP